MREEEVDVEAGANLCIFYYYALSLCNISGGDTDDIPTHNISQVASAVESSRASLSILFKLHIAV